MQKFTFKATETLVKYVEIEAIDELWAVDLAQAMLAGGNIDFSKNFDDYDATIELV